MLELIIFADAYGAVDKPSVQIVAEITKALGV